MAVVGVIPLLIVPGCVRKQIKQAMGSKSVNSNSSMISASIPASGKLPLL